METNLVSKSEKKRAMDALQQLGAELVSLSYDQLSRMSMPDSIREAVMTAIRITQHKARKRQLQYIGRLMRDVDANSIRDELNAIKGVSAESRARFHKTERLRTRLLADENTLGDIIQTYPHADLLHLRQLRRNALKEQQASKPPRSFRELFRALHALEEYS